MNKLYVTAYLKCYILLVMCISSVGAFSQTCGITGGPGPVSVNIIVNASCEAVIDAPSLLSQSIAPNGCTGAVLVVESGGVVVSTGGMYSIPIADIEASVCGATTLPFTIYFDADGSPTGDQPLDINVAVMDAMPPMPTCPPNPPVVNACNAAAAGGPPPAHATIAAFEAAGGDAGENCDMFTSFMTIASVDVSTVGDCVNSEIITRTYTITDCSGSAGTCEQVFSYRDFTPPTFTVPADVVIDCAADESDLALTGDVTDETDICTITTMATFVDVVSAMDPCDGSTVITRTWSLSDDCDNAAADQVQVITKTDMTAPTFTVPADVVIDCAADESDLALTGDVTDEADNCDSDIDEATFVDVVSAMDPCDGSTVITRTWSLSDDCDNAAADQVQVITKSDITPPIAQCVLTPVVLTLDATTCTVTVLPSDIEDGSTDNCAVGMLTLEISKDGGVTFFDDVTGVTLIEGDDFNLCSDAVSLVLRVTDPCGNSSTCTKSVNLMDDVPPVAVCPVAQVVVNLSYDFATCSYTTGVLAANSLGDGSSTDNCDDDVTETNLERTYTCDEVGIRNVTLTATDDCNNTSQAVCQIEVKREDPPVQWTNPGPLCTTDVFPLDLTAFVTNPQAITCGFWTGDFVTDLGMFNPPVTAAGVYSVTFNLYGGAPGCEVFLTRAINIIDIPAEPASVTLHEECTISASGVVSLTDLFPGVNNEFLDNTDPAVTITVTGGATLVGSAIKYDEAGCYSVQWQYGDPSPCADDRDVTSFVLVTEMPQPSFDIQDQVCWSAGDPGPHTYPAKCNSPVYDAAGTLTTTYSIQSGPATVVPATGVVTVTGVGIVMICKKEELAYAACGTAVAGKCEAEVCVQMNVEDGTAQAIDFSFAVGEYCIGDVVDLSTTTPGGIYTGVGVIDAGDGSTGTFTIPSCGVHAVTYTLNSSNGCTASITNNIITDLEAPAVTAPIAVVVECGSEDIATWVASGSATDNCPSLTPIVVPTLFNTISDCGNARTEVWLFTATDACGNIGVALSTYTIVDTTVPTINDQTDMTFACAEMIPVPVAPTVSDLCTATSDLAIEFSEALTSDDGPNCQVLTRTWIVTDLCGNSASDIQVITIQDDIAPAAIAPAPLSLTCGDVLTVPTVVFTDNCTPTDDIIVIFSEVITSNDGPNCFTLLRSWTGVDQCLNSTTITQVVTVSDTEAPVVVAAPLPVAQDCGDVLTVPSVTFTDNCTPTDDIIIDFSEVITSNDGPNCFTLLRSWTGIDQCGNITIVTQTVTVSDSVDPTISLSSTAAALSCGDDIDGTLPTVTLGDNCTPIDDLIVDFSEIQVNDQAGDCQELLRTWIVTDQCGNTASATQTVTISDTEVPTITLSNTAASLSCGDNVNATLPTVTLTDNCTPIAALDIDFSEIVVNDQAGDCQELLRTWIVTDYCGNMATATQTVTISDTEVPTISGIDATISLTCADELSTPQVPVLTDNCTPADDLNVDFSEVLSDNDGTNCFVLTRTWVVTDYCGNLASATQVVTVNDDIAPTISVTPATLALTCADELTTPPTPVVDDNCDASEVVVDFSEVLSDNDGTNCFVITRTWVATDACGNMATATQVVTVTDDVAPTLVEAQPDDELVMCGSAIPAVPALTFNDNCADAVVVDFSEVTNSVNSANEILITRTWVATDACGNSITVDQVVTVMDVTGPVITTCPTNINADNDSGVCGAIVTYDIPTFNDNCDPNGTIGTLTLGLNSGDIFPIGVTTVEYTFFDVAGNQLGSPCSFTVTIADNENPQFQNCPTPGFTVDVFTNDCVSGANWSIPVAVDNCSGVSVAAAATNTIAQGDANVAPGMYTLTYVATDATGNTATCEFVVNVLDTENPVLTCPAQSAVTVKGTDINCQFVMASVALDATASENCGIMSLTHDFTSASSASNNTLNGHTFDLGNSTVTWTATDDSGNTATCVVIITVEDDVDPTFVCPADMTVSGCEGIVPNLISGLTGLDNCSDAANVSFTQSPPAGTLFGPSPGATIDITITATDEAGNESSCITVLTVVDNLMPVFLDCPLQPLVFGNDVDDCSAFVNWDVPIAQDNCSDPITPVQTAGPTPGTQQAVGTYTISYTATDADGNFAICTFNVVVTDTQSPWLMAGIPVDMTLNCEEAATFEPFVMNSTHVMDNCTDPVIDIVNGFVSGQGADPALCDFYTYNDLYTWTATDAVGNSSLWKQVVSFEDVTAPVMTLPLDMTIECGTDSTPATTGTATAVDNCAAEANIDVVFVDVFTPSCGLAGTIVRTWTATDPCGNFTTADQTILIEDTTAPALVCMDITVDLDTNGGVTISAQDVITSVSDVCSDDADLVFAMSQTQFTCANTGINEVLLVVTDPCGNESACTLNVTVEDNVNPSITCPSDLDINLDPGACDAMVLSMAIATDNCSAIVTYSPDITSLSLPIGITTVTATATDPSGNTAVCNFDVNVVEFVPTSNDLACNNHINLSLDNNCSAVILADMILEGNNYGCYDDYCVEITTASGFVHANLFDITDINQTFTVSITDCQGSGNSCWGTVLIEEKLIPQVQCPADVTITCNFDSELIDTSTNMLFTGELLLLTCEPGGETRYEDVFTDNGACSTPRGVIERTWIFDDGQGNEVSCVQNITIAGFDLADVVFPQDYDIANPFECSVINEWPLLTTPDGYPFDPIDSTTWNDGTGFPMVNGLAIQSSGNLCGVSVNMTDEIFDICEGSYEILRTWKVRNMCGPVTPTNPLIHTQVIKVLDSQGPNLGICPGDLEVSTDPWTCEAGLLLPLPEKFHDLCSSATFAADIYGGGFLNIEGTVAENNLVVYAGGMEKGGSHLVVYSVADACGNISTCNMNITVYDGTAPVAIARQNIVISLTSSGTNTNGNAKLFTTSVNDGSHDNCSGVGIEIRRVSDACDIDGNDTFNADGHPQDGSSNPSSPLYDADGGLFVKFCCEDLTDVDTDGVPYGIVEVEMRVWDDANNDGVFGTTPPPGMASPDNYNTTWVNVRVEDKSAPSLNCPADITITCDMDETNLAITGTAEVFANCTTLDATYTDQGALVCGAGTITRTWKY